MCTCVCSGMFACTHAQSPEQPWFPPLSLSLPYSFGGEGPAEPEVCVLALGWQPAGPSDPPSSALLRAGLQACMGCWV